MFLILKARIDITSDDSSYGYLNFDLEHNKNDFSKLTVVLNPTDVISTHSSQTTQPCHPDSTFQSDHIEHDSASILQSDENLEHIDPGKTSQATEVSKSNPCKEFEKSEMFEHPVHCQPDENVARNETLSNIPSKTQCETATAENVATEVKSLKDAVVTNEVATFVDSESIASNPDTVHFAPVISQSTQVPCNVPVVSMADVSQNMNNQITPEDELNTIKMMVGPVNSVSNVNLEHVASLGENHGLTTTDLHQLHEPNSPKIAIESSDVHQEDSSDISNDDDHGKIYLADNASSDFENNEEVQQNSDVDSEESENNIVNAQDSGTTRVYKVLGHIEPVQMTDSKSKVSKHKLNVQTKSVSTNDTSGDLNYDAGRKRKKSTKIIRNTVEEPNNTRAACVKKIAHNTDFFLKMQGKNKNNEYVCLICDMKFSFQTNLTRHQKVVHGKSQTLTHEEGSGRDDDSKLINYVNYIFLNFRPIT